MIRPNSFDLKMNQLLQWSEQQYSHLMIILLYFILFMFFLFLIINWFSKPESKLPPSPTKLPVIGNLHQLHGSPQHAFKSLALKHGPLMLLHLGSKPTLVVSSAEIARDVMKNYDHVFSSRPELKFAKRLTYGKDIGFAPYGEYWMQVRKVCVLQLLNAKKVQSFQFVREEEVGLVMDKINDSSAVVNLSEILVFLSNDVVCRVALGKKYNEGEVGNNFKGMLKEYGYLLAVSNVGDFIPSLAWLNHFNGLNSRVEKLFIEIDSFIDQVIEEHIEKKKKKRIGSYYHSGDNEEEEDFVDVMLGIEKGDGDHDISWAKESTKAIIFDMFAAGTDTSAVVLEWAMSELIRHPNIMEEVQKEVRRIAKGKIMIIETDMDEMHYLKSVIKETLRLHPPVPLLLPRESMEKVQIQGYEIPAKTTVMINVFAIGRDPKLWDEAEKFLPKRFLNGGNAASIDFKGQDFHFIPFGAGRRGCPGILFATSIMELTLANLLNRFDWALPEGMNGKDLDMEENFGLTVHRKKDLVLTPKPHYH